MRLDIEDAEFEAILVALEEAAAAAFYDPANLDPNTPHPSDTPEWALVRKLFPNRPIPGWWEQKKIQQRLDAVETELAALKKRESEANHMRWERHFAAIDGD